jgi:hypothetical protein
MRIFVRYLLWILIAALPLQGGAVAFMSCGSGAGQASSSSRLPDASADEAHAGAHREHCDAGGANHAGSPHGKCSHCASCCVGAAAPPAIPSDVLPPTFSTFAAVAVEPAMTAYIPATLERPPRRYA